MADAATTELLAEIKQLTSAMKDLVGTSSRVNSSMKWYEKILQDTNEEAQTYVDNLTQGKTLTEKEQALADKLLKSKNEELKITNLINKAKKDLALAKDDKTRLGLSQVVNKLEKDKTVASKAVTKDTDVLSKSLGGVIGNLKLFGGVITWLVGLLVGQYQQAKEMIGANAGWIEATNFAVSIVNQQKEAIKRGIDPVAFAKITTNARQLMNAMGGTANAMLSFDGESQMIFRGLTNSLEEAYQSQIEAMEQLARSGIKPTESALKAYGYDLEKVAQLTGMQAAQAMALYNEVATEVDSLYLLKAAREGEREAILASQRAMINNAIAAGMSAEQAKNAAKMLNKMVAAKPLERMKQAARLRALGGALGIAGSEQAAAAVQAGPRATAEQQEQLRAFMTASANTADAAKGLGMGQEIFTTSLLEKLDLDKFLGSDSPFSTTLAETMAVSKEQLDSMKLIRKDAVGAGIMQAELIENQIKLMLTGNGLMGGILTIIEKIYDALPSWMKSSVEKPMSVKDMQEYVKQGGQDEKTGRSIRNFSDIAGAEKWRRDRDAATSELAAQSMTKATAPKEAPKEAPKTSAAENLSKEAPKTSAAENLSAQYKRNEEEQQKKAEETKAVAEQTKTVAASTNQGINQQLKTMSSTNELLTKIEENTQKQIDLAEKQLAALVASEDDKKSEGFKSALFGGIGFISNYVYHK